MRLVDSRSSQHTSDFVSLRQLRLIDATVPNSKKILHLLLFIQAGPAKPRKAPSTKVRPRRPNVLLATPRTNPALVCPALLSGAFNRFWG